MKMNRKLKKEEQQQQRESNVFNAEHFVKNSKADSH